MKWIPHAYQKTAVGFMVSLATAGLFLDPGLGKTAITLAAFNLMRRKGYIKRMLVIAPLRPAYSVWPGEVLRWDEFSDLKIELLHGDNKNAALRRVLCGSNHVDINVINPEGLPWLSEQLARNSHVFPWDMLVIDESTRFKITSTQRFKILKPLLPRFKRRYILTGSPAPNGLLDLFGQIFILDLGRTLGSYVSHYRVRFFNPGGYLGYQWTLRAGADKEIYNLLKPIVLRMDARDLLEMPPLIGVDPPGRVEVELPPKAMAQYKQMEDTLITQVKDGLVVAANAAAASTKCRQIANGGIYTNGPGQARKWENLHEAKVDAVEEIVEELQGKPALIAYEYAHDLDRLRRRLGNVPHIGGGVTPKRFHEIETAWNAGELPVLLAQPQSVAHGINLQGTGAAVIWAGLTWDLENYEQLYKRIWRQGQKEKVIVHHIVAKKTVDEIIIRGLTRKDHTQRGLLDALKEYARDR